jgi:short-subunit dehydrogenase
MKTVFITGINRGLGEKLFDLFASNNFFVYGVVRNEKAFEKLKNKFPANSQIILADLSTDKSIKLIQENVKNNSIDLLINNAGTGGKETHIKDVDSAEIIDLFNIHCLGVFRTIKALNINLIRAENPIVLNLNSRLGSITRQSNGLYKKLAVSYSYRIAKASQNMLTNCLRLEYKNKIQFISIHPGKMNTELAQIDANIEPDEVAIKILNFYKNGKLKEENGIIELEKDLIEW